MQNEKPASSCAADRFMRHGLDNVWKVNKMANLLHFVAHEKRCPLVNPLPPDRQYSDDISTNDMLVNFFCTLFLFVCSTKCTASRAGASPVGLPSAGSAPASPAARFMLQT